MLFSIALISAAAMAFTYVGYPLLAFALSRLAGRPVRKSPYRPRVSVIMAVHNEGARVAKKVSNLLCQDYLKEQLEIVVVDDGSSDASIDALRSEYGEEMEIISLPMRFGKASALNVGMEAATGEVLVFTDARQTLRRNAVSRLTENFADPDVTAVTGCLKSRGEGADGLFRRYEEALRGWEASWGSCSGAAGALYAVRRSAVVPLTPETILDDLVISIAATRTGRLVYEPAAVALEPAGAEKRTWTRRLRTLAGNWQLFLHPLRYRNVFTARTIAQLVCHKLLRLLFPFFLAGLVACIIAAVPSVGLSLLAGGVLIAAGALVFTRGAPAVASQIVLSMVLAPLGALVRYVTRRETVLWARQ